jgi:hypothetical protein
MTVQLEAAATPDAGRPRGSGRVIATGLVIVMLAAALVGFVWWDRHPNLIPAVGGSESSPDAVGHAIVIDAEVATIRGHDSGTETRLPDGGSTLRDTGNTRGYRVTIRSVRPNIVTNSSDATVRMEVCTRNAAHVHTRVDGSKEHDMYCPSYEPVGHQKVEISDAPGASWLAVVVTPHRPGVVRIAGFSVSYREGIRRQTQTGGIDVTVRSR